MTTTTTTTTTTMMILDGLIRFFQQHSGIRPTWSGSGEYHLSWLTLFNVLLRVTVSISFIFATWIFMTWQIGDGWRWCSILPVTSNRCCRWIRTTLSVVQATIPTALNRVWFTSAFMIHYWRIISNTRVCHVIGIVLRCDVRELNCSRKLTSSQLRLTQSEIKSQSKINAETKIRWEK